MSRWNHAICGECWLLKHPDEPRWPAVVVGAEAQTCCYCGRETVLGIFVRDDPAATPCKGKHEGASPE